MRYKSSFMKHGIALLGLMLVLSSASVFASGRTPELRLKDGRVFTPQNVKNDGEYDVYDPFELVGSCYRGSSERLVKEVLLHDDFLDHFGDYSCDVEAQLSADGRVISYKC